ncbi:MAG: hypothetical protein UR60_C0028G0013 [Candidatus Moranbacteria bacterium GW2011_GWF2_34_56]|nr:MAG: hypothetical protein UR51_C0002G0159 [Candidatus Moranbacteria bacterium GW2011_GWF1_34_10]KKP64133.1 MAG: hypothetical protein UR60_C0028G0013 [Candidatus Moranbacteria bacterium GW2011_GWF2_34_56]
MKIKEAGLFFENLLERFLNGKNIEFIIVSNFEMRYRL